MPGYRRLCRVTGEMRLSAAALVGRLFILIPGEEELGVLFERDLELIEKGFLKTSFGETGVLDQQGDRDLTERMIVQVDLCSICTVDVFLGRDHIG